MQLNFVSHRCFLYLFMFNIILLTNNEAKPMPKTKKILKLEQTTPKIEKKMGKATDKPKQPIRLFDNKPEPQKISPRSGRGEERRGGIDEKTVVELTISIPRFKMNAMGNWVYNPWGVTYGKVWEDTRFNIGRENIPRMLRESHPVKDYYPYTGHLDTVCIGKSTAYNKPQILNWLPHHMYKYTHNEDKMTIMKSLRRTLHDKANPEECHTANYTQFREYQECAMMRNQRMEAYIPKYPRHQRPPS